MIENGRKLNCTKLSNTKQLKFESLQNESEGGAVKYKHFTQKFKSENVKLPENVSPDKIIVHRGHIKFNHSNHRQNTPSVAMDHVELHFNITNVFKDNSADGPYSAQHYIEYEELEIKNNSTISDRTLGNNNGGSTERMLSTGKAAKINNKKTKAKYINAPVYLIFT